MAEFEPSWGNESQFRADVEKEENDFGGAFNRRPHRDDVGSEYPKSLDDGGSPEDIIAVLRRHPEWLDEINKLMEADGLFPLGKGKSGDFEYNPDNLKPNAPTPQLFPGDRAGR